MNGITALLEPVYASRMEPTKDRSWRMPAHPFPVSLTEQEGTIIQETIRMYDLRSGYELATGFGMSSFYAGLALRENGGTLLSMDCYSEERARTPRAEPEMPTPHFVSDGLAFALQGRRILGLDTTIRYLIGRSPDHVAAALDGLLLDYIFIDGQHAGIAPLMDTLAVIPFVAPRAVLAFHDAGSTSVDTAVDVATLHLDGRIQRCATRHNLTLVYRGIEE
jgi:hypothetical protein